MDIAEDQFEYWIIDDYWKRKIFVSEQISLTETLFNKTIPSLAANNFSCSLELEVRTPYFVVLQDQNQSGNFLNSCFRLICILQRLWLENKISPPHNSNIFIRLQRLWLGTQPIWSFYWNKKFGKITCQSRVTSRLGKLTVDNYPAEIQNIFIKEEM